MGHGLGVSPFARRARRLAMVSAATAVIAGCGGSGFQYVQNDDFNAYFKVDEDWRLFDEEDFFAIPALQLDPLERQRRLATTWIGGRCYSANQETIKEIAASWTIEVSP